MSATIKAVKLTRRETQVLTLVVEGKSAKEVADTLSIAKPTVDFHLNNAYKKLDVINRVQAYRQAVLMGIIPPVSEATWLPM